MSEFVPGLEGVIAFETEITSLDQVAGKMGAGDISISCQASSIFISIRVARLGQALAHFYRPFFTHVF